MRLLVYTLLFVLTAGTAIGAPEKKETAQKPKWVLVWKDEFNGNKINPKHWSKCERGTPDWCNTMSDDPSLFAVKGGNLILRGKVNPDTKKDPSPFITGGVYSKGKVAVRYGKVEIRAKFDSAQGAWPALWMLPDGKDRRWPDGGEIDIMEHLNFDKFAYQTLHSKFITTLKRCNPQNGSTGTIDKDDYNVYAVVWTPDSITFLINDKPTLTYPRIPAERENGQWPYCKPFYLLLDMQLGGSWVGAVNPKHLPVEMHIDYVRIYKDANADYEQVLKVKK